MAFEQRGHIPDITNSVGSASPCHTIEPQQHRAPSLGSTDLDGVCQACS